MTQLTSLFSTLLSMSLMALPVIAVVLLTRALLRSAPKRYRYALWAVVGFRLACPVSFSQVWSLFNLRPLRQVAEAAEAVSGGFTAPENLPAPIPGGAVTVVPLSGGEIALKIAAVLWLLGLAALLVYGVLSTLRLRRTVSTAVLRETNVYECDGIASPFVLGFFRPKIYIPFHLDDNDRTYVLCHERSHIRRRDYLVKPLAFLLLAVYWWNPLVWLCYSLCCRDMEMSCDETVLNVLGDRAKVGYGNALVDFATQRRFPAASPLAFGEHDAKNRVKNVLHWKKMSPAISFLALCAVALVAMVCTSNATSNATADGKSWVQVEADRGSGAGVHYTVHLAESVQSWALYEDVYEGGLLLSSRSCLLAGFSTDGPLLRRFSATLNTVQAVNNASYRQTCVYQSDGAQTNWQTDLPDKSYTGAGAFPGPEGAKEQYSLEENGELLLLTCLFSTKADGGVERYNAEADLSAVNDTVVRFRFVTSTQTAEQFSATVPVSAAAQSLFALRTPYLGDAPAVGKLLEALQTGALDDYSMELLTAKPPLTLQINFKTVPADIDPTSPRTDREMTRRAALLLALVDNLQQVNWTYPSREDGIEALITVYQTRQYPDECAQALGYADIKDLGKTPEGIQALQGYLQNDPATWWTNYLNDVSNNGFLLSEYALPQEADLAEIFYNGAGLPDGVNVPQAMVSAYEKATGSTVQTDLSRVDAAAADAFLQEKCGTNLQDHAKGLQNWVYLPREDVYLFQHGDTNWRGVELLDIAVTLETAVIQYKTEGNDTGIWEVTLKNNEGTQNDGGTWQFTSNLPQ